MTMDRRDLLRKAGIGSLALATLPALVDALAGPAWAQGGTNFHFLAQSAAGPGPGTPASPQHRIIMSGEGTFDPARPGSQVTGGGTFTHFLFPGAGPPTGGTPLPIVGSGTWKARLLVSYRQIGTYGVFAAGTAELVVDLFAEMPAKTVSRGARLQVNCNLGAAGLSTGLAEGYVLSIPGTDFFTGGTPGPFVPLAPNVGLTLFTTVALPS